MIEKSKQKNVKYNVKICDCIPHYNIGIKIISRSYNSIKTWIIIKKFRFSTFTLLVITYIDFAPTFHLNQPPHKPPNLRISKNQNSNPALKLYYIRATVARPLLYHHVIELIIQFRDLETRMRPHARSARRKKAKRISIVKWSSRASAHKSRDAPPSARYHNYRRASLFARKSAHARVAVATFGRNYTNTGSWRGYGGFPFWWRCGNVDSVYSFADVARWGNGFISEGDSCATPA